MTLAQTREVLKDPSLELQESRVSSPRDCEMHYQEGLAATYRQGSRVFNVRLCFDKAGRLALVSMDLERPKNDSSLLKDMMSIYGRPVHRDKTNGEENIHWISGGSFVELYNADMFQTVFYRAYKPEANKGL